MFRRCTTEENALKLSVTNTIMSDYLPYTQPLVHLLGISLLQGLLNPGIRQKRAGDVLLTDSRWAHHPSLLSSLTLNKWGNVWVPVAPRRERGLRQVECDSAPEFWATSTEFSTAVNNSTSPCKTLWPLRQAVRPNVWQYLQGLSAQISSSFYTRNSHVIAFDPELETHRSKSCTQRWFTAFPTTWTHTLTW